MEQLKLMCILAHPDDESLSVGGTLAKYAAEGVETYLVTATRGERGWFGDEPYPGAEAVGRIREAELRAAANALGLGEVTFLDYMDGDLDQANPNQVIAKIVTELRRVRPQVVITFDPTGDYGHPDHIAISQFTTAALVAAADSSYPDAETLPSHRVSKLYYRVSTHQEQAAYQAAFGDLVMQIDGQLRRATAWEDWAITTRLDTAAYWEQVWQAITCHRSQLPTHEALQTLPDEYRHTLADSQTFYRAYSLVNGGRAVERDLFEGIRPAAHRQTG